MVCLQQGLDHLAWCMGMLLVIRLQPAADRSAHFERMARSTLTHSVFAVC